MLDAYLQKEIEKFVRKTFNSLRLHLLGPSAIPKSLLFSFHKFDPQTTLAANYLAANSLNSVDLKSVDKDTINKIKTVAEYYIDSLEKKSMADIHRIIGEQYDNLNLEAKRTNVDLKDIIMTAAGQKIMKEIGKELSTQKDRLDGAVETMITHELHNAQNAGALDGIIGASKALGIEDPVVFKIGVNDVKRCKYCWRLWTLKDKVTPKVYKLSELSGSPGDRKNPDPSVSPTHINCRDILTILMPGFSFNENGKIVYLNKDHNEFKKQRS